MDKSTNVATSAGYAEQLDKTLKDSVSNWWNQLSKEDLLQLIADRPQITADMIRDMFSTYNMTLGFAVQYNSTLSTATAQFEDN